MYLSELQSFSIMMLIRIETELWQFDVARSENDLVTLINHIESQDSKYLLNDLYKF